MGKRTLFRLAVLVEGVRRIAVIITETQFQLGRAITLFITGNRERRTDVVHPQLAESVHITLKVILTEILHQLLYKMNQYRKTNFSFPPKYTFFSSHYNPTNHTAQNNLNYLVMIP